MSISIENREGGEVSIVLGERFDFGSVEQFRKSYEGLTGIKSKCVHIDFRNTRYMDSSALGMLINAKSFFTTNEARVKLVSVNAQIKKIFSISRFETKFDIE